MLYELHFSCQGALEAIENPPNWRVALEPRAIACRLPYRANSFTLAKEPFPRVHSVESLA